MPILTTKLGVHENVTMLEFGTGDIMFATGKEDPEKKSNMLLFWQDQPGEIARTDNKYKGKSTDETDYLKMVFKFTNPKSITSLIHSLIELQEEML